MKKCRECGEDLDSKDDTVCLECYLDSNDRYTVIMEIQEELSISPQT